jgi:CheY-like chemotaxis protein
VRSPEFPKNGYINSLRMTEADEVEVIEALSRNPTNNAGKERRRQSRVPYEHRAGLIVQMHHPGGSVATYLVRVRDLSTGGVGFLHGSFVYCGTRCTMALLTTDGKTVCVEGKVVRCSHVRKHIHQIGLRFNTPIRLRDFVAGAMMPLDDQTQTSKELPKLCGHVMYVEDSVSDQDLLTFHLSNVGVKVKAVSSVLAAIELANELEYDAVLANIWLPAMSGLDLADYLRGNGYKGPIIALTADDREEVCQDAIARGCTSVLVKPYVIETLVSLLEPYLSSRRAMDCDQVVLSSLWADERMQPLIRTFLKRMKETIAEMGRVLETGKASAGLRKLCLDVKGSAGGYGFPQISEAAQEMLELLLAEAEIDRLKPSFAQLAGLSRAACMVLDHDQGTAGSTVGTATNRAGPKTRAA